MSELDGHEGIEPELLEGAMGIESTWGGKAEDDANFGAHEIEQRALAIGGRQREETLLDRRSGSDLGGDGARRAGSDKASKHWSQRVCVGGAEGAGVEGYGDESGVGASEGSVEEGEAFVGGEGTKAPACHRRRSASPRCAVKPVF